MCENDLILYAYTFHLLQISKLNFNFFKECGNGCEAHSTTLVNLLSTTNFGITNSAFCPQIDFICFQRNAALTVTLSLNIIISLFCMTEMKNVYWAVRKGSLNKIQHFSSFKG